jgi:radical SAM protein with 4Fe4S-binding SPASM domain
MSDQGVKSVYKKHDSFATFISNKSNKILQEQTLRVIPILKSAQNTDPAQRKTLRLALNELLNHASNDGDFTLTRMAAEEMAVLSDQDLPRYMYHRYRYQVFPKQQITDSYPPYVQIEPTSICNFRCIFCYQTNRSFSDKEHGFMGSMTMDTFKMIVEQLQGNVEFISISSRGEPLINKNIDQMLEYCVGRFLSLKLNTNASMLTEKIAHAILAGGVGTCVFSVDAANEEMFSRLRVNGNLQRVLKNIEMFQDIRAKHYPDSKIITRVSGVYVDDRQDIGSMQQFWGALVDQITFVSYNPWENIYAREANGLEAQCSDLWRRMFVWHDGKVNPCDCDYKSNLSVGSIQNSSIADLWQSEAYNRLRKAHSTRNRQNMDPCLRCSFT